MENPSMTTVCAWCERPIKTAVEAEGKQYCQRFCAAQALIDTECEENDINDDHGALTALFVEAMIYEGPKKYGVKVRDCDAEEYVHLDDLDRADFYPIIAVIDDDKTPDWTPADLAQAIRDGKVTVGL
jgi:hypothetical protein